MNSNWYAVSVYARQEKAALVELNAQGFVTYLPLSRVRRAWSDRVKAVDVALFPGYLFVKTCLDAQTRVRIVKPRAVFDIIGRTKTESGIVAHAIPDSQMESLQLLVNSQRTLEPIDKLVKGTEVHIIQGPFRGATGIVEREPSGHRRLVVQIPLLGRGVRAELSADDLLSGAEMVA